MTGIKKIWGTTEPLIVTPMFEMHRLRIEAGFACSIHKHQFKHNAFYLLGGELLIEAEGGDGRLATHSLLLGKPITIAPGIFHRFRTKGTTRATALEMYFTEPLSEDIIRRNVGGPA